MIEVLHICKNELCEHEWIASMFYENGQYFYEYGDCCPMCGTKGSADL